ncbi:MAG: ComEA family DNA-binding protein [Oscillospiraceae bacterium]|nr:ComEA family DNA-binding protein [Oscillospiraceae bacterium]
MKEIKGSAVLIILTLALCCFFGGFLLGNIGGDRAEISTQQSLTTTASTLDSRDSAEDDESNIFPININTADLYMLMELPEIGEVFAQRIIDYREQTGPFLSIEEIMMVKGIGEGRFEELKHYITVGDVPAPQTEPPTGGEDAAALININTAEKEELMSLPGIGETYAEQIIAYREEQGPFTSIEEIMKVSGIGESRFESLKGLITVGDVAPTETQNKEDESTGFPVNINTADLETLMTLPGIGETYAQRIIDYREENGVFSSIEEIMEVSGISESRFEKIKDYITVEDTE